MNKKLNDIISYATEHVQYYAQMVKEKNDENNILGKIVPSTKEDIVDSYDMMFSDEVKREELISELTSGSTGKSLVVYKSKQERASLTCILHKRRMQYFKKIMHAKMTKFATSYGSFNNRKVQEIITEPIDIDGRIYLPNLYVNEENARKYMKILENYEETWIYSSPSSMYKLAKEVDKIEDFPINKIKYIELAGEYVIQSQQEYIQKVFQCPVVNQYGTREFWGIAYECPCHHLHVMNESVFVEILDDNNEPVPYGTEGKVVVTGLRARSMPFLRYVVGDSAKLFPSNCECGSKEDILEINSARIADVIMLENGDTMKSILFFQILAIANKGKVRVAQFQIRQNTILDFSLLFVLTSDDEKEYVEGIFTSYLKKHISDNVNLTFSYTDNIPIDEKTKKMRYFYPMKSEESGDLG